MLTVMCQKAIVNRQWASYGPKKGNSDKLPSAGANLKAHVVRPGQRVAIGAERERVGEEVAAIQ